MDGWSDSNLLEELSASALMREPDSERSIDPVAPAFDELPSDPTHPDPKSPVSADSDDEPSLEIHFDELAEPSTHDPSDWSSTSELGFDSAEDLTVKQRPSWSPPLDAFEDEELDDDALTARRPSPVPPAPKPLPPPLPPPEPSRLPFRSAPVLLRPFGGAAHLPRPSPLPPRVPWQPHAPLEQRSIPVERVRLSALSRSTQDSPLPIPLHHVRPSTSEWDDSGTTARTTLVPFGFAVDAVKHKLRTRSMPLLAGAAAGLALFLMMLLLSRAESVRAAGQGGPVLFVTVAGPNGRAIDETRVFLDGMLRCTATPCRVSDVPRGMHFVSVAAEGFQTSAARVVQVTDVEPTAVHVDLEPVQHGKPEEAPVPLLALPTEPPPRDVAVAPTIATQSLGVAPTIATQSVEAAPTQAPAFAPSPTPTIAWGYLNLNSIPASSVVVDGKPLGFTPRVAVRVRAGSHDVVFVHPDRGRRNQSVLVTPGGKQTVAVRF